MKFFDTLAQTFANKPIDWDELEESLIRADLGVPITTRIIEKLQDREAWSVLGINDVIKVARAEIAGILPDKPAPILPAHGKPVVILIVGVNGTGKTTSTAKLAHYLQDRHRVMLAAADTFRAAAIEQLGIWAERLGVEMIRGQYNADPAALCYEAYQAAAKREIEFLDLRHRRPPTHQSEPHGRASKSETRSGQTRSDRATRNAARCRCNHWRQCAQPGPRISQRHRPHRFDRDQTRWQRQRRNCRRHSGRTGNSDALCRHRRKDRRFRAIRRREFVAKML